MRGLVEEFGEDVGLLDNAARGASEADKRKICAMTGPNLFDKILAHPAVKRAAASCATYRRRADSDDEHTQRTDRGGRRRGGGLQLLFARPNPGGGFMLCLIAPLLAIWFPLQRASSSGSGARATPARACNRHRHLGAGGRGHCRRACLVLPAGAHGGAKRGGGRDRFPATPRRVSRRRTWRPASLRSSTADKWGHSLCTTGMAYREVFYFSTFQIFCVVLVRLQKSRTRTYAIAPTSGAARPRAARRRRSNIRCADRRASCPGGRARARPCSGCDRRLRLGLCSATSATGAARSNSPLQLAYGHGYTKYARAGGCSTMDCGAGGCGVSSLNAKSRRMEDELRKLHAQLFGSHAIATLLFAQEIACPFGADCAEFHVACTQTSAGGRVARPRDRSRVRYRRP